MNLILRSLLVLSAAFPWEAAMSGETQAENKVVLITGASRGIGLATAEYLAENGYRVYAGVRDSASLNQSLDQNLRFEVLDVTDPLTIQRTVNKIIENEGRLDVLINNAGYALGGPVECLRMSEAQEQMDVNFFGVIRMCQEVLPHMRKQLTGRIINISSVQGVYGQPFGSLYTASKAALESLSEALSIEVLPWNIDVSIVEPGPVATDFSVKLGSRELEQNPYQRICDLLAAFLQIKRVPSESCQSPQEIAQFLQTVIEDSSPQLRYQTSNSVKEAVSQSLKDVSGKEYSIRMKAQVDAWLSSK